MIFDSNEQAFGTVDTKSFASLKSFVTKCYEWNRRDIIKKLVQELSKSTDAKDNQAKEKVEEYWTEQRANNPGEADRPGGSVHNWIEDQSYFPALPAVLPIHAHSVISFLRAKTGNAVTGVVVVFHAKTLFKTKTKDDWDDDDTPPKGPAKGCKIFLFPLDADDTNASGNEKARGARPYDKNNKSLTEAKIWKTGDAGNPIVHGGTDNPSHKQLVEKVTAKKVYNQLVQDQGDFIGFTVHKGKPDGIPNRYVFTSASSNSKAFPSTKLILQPNPLTRTNYWGPDPNEDQSLKKPNTYITKEWGLKIANTVNELLSFEAALKREGIHVRSAEYDVLFAKVKDWQKKQPPAL